MSLDREILTSVPVANGIERAVKTTSISERRQDVVVERRDEGIVIMFGVDRTDQTMFRRVSGSEVLSPDEARHLGNLLIAIADVIS